MKCAIFTTMPKGVYSGGRYASYILAECLAHLGHEVYFITNNEPIFINDFANYPEHDDVNLILTDDFQQNLPEGQFDFVFLVPHQNPSDFFYSETKEFSRSRNAKLILINFESPNWFNEYAPVKRPENKWNQWLECTARGCLVLSISRESQKYAEQYYTKYPKRTHFDYWYPAMNEIEMNRSSAVEKENRILCVTRIDDPHKGANDVISLMSKEFADFTFVFMLGKDVKNKKTLEKLKLSAEKNNINLDFKYKLSDYEKFIEFKKAKVTVFPSYFEGYGYPPIESLSCGTPCVAYYLPVLEEICGDGTVFVKSGDIDALRSAILRTLNEHKSEDTLKAAARSCSNLEVRAEQINLVLERFDKISLPKPPKPPRAKISLPKFNLKNMFKRFRTRTEVGISKAYVDDSIVKFNGYIIAGKRVTSVKAFCGEQVLNSDFGFNRPDVTNKHPHLHTSKIGFMVYDICESVSKPIKLQFYCYERLVKATIISIDDLKAKPTTLATPTALKCELSESKIANDCLIIRGFVFANDRLIDLVKIGCDGEILGETKLCHSSAGLKHEIAFELMCSNKEYDINKMMLYLYDDAECVYIKRINAK